MTCPRCAKVNEDGAQFCSRCGLDFSKVDFGPTADDGDAVACYRHPKRMTRLSCGRCGNAVCEDCVVIGSAGPRCPDCAKSNVPIRPAAVGLEIKRFFRSLTKMSPWMWIVGFFLLMGLFRGCGGILGSMRGGGEIREPVIEQGIDEEAEPGPDDASR